MSRLGALFAFASLFLHAACGGATPGSICDQICECQGGCTDSERETCVEGVREQKFIAINASCGDQFQIYADCVDGAVSCVGSSVAVQGCEQPQTSLETCIGAPTVLPVGNACDRAVRRIIDHYASCGIPIAEPVEAPSRSEQLATSTSCIADCVEVASCGALTGTDPDGSVEFADCITVCD